MPDLAGGDLRVADLNGDGLSDLVYVRANTLTVSLGSPAGGFLNGVPVASQTTLFRIEHLDADDRLDLAVVDRAGQLDVLFGNGDGSFRAPRSLETSVARLLGAGDLDGDGAADIVIETALSRAVWLSSARNFAPVEFGIERSVQANDSSPQVWNAQVWRAPDGTLQLVLTDTSLQIYSYIQSGDGWSLQQRLSGGLVGATDFNDDGRLDLALQDQDQDSIQLQLGQRDGAPSSRECDSLAPASLPPT